MNQMIVSNLLHRPIRSLVSVIAVAVEVALILLMVGLALGLIDDARKRQEGIGADVVVLPPGASFLVGMSGSPMPGSLARVLQKLPHVQVVAPIVMKFNTESTVEVIYGVDLKSYEALAPFHFLSGGPFQGPYDVMVDDLFANSAKVKVGDKIKLLNNEFRICAIVEQGKGARKFVPIQTLQDLIGSQDHVSAFYIKDDKAGDYDTARQVVGEIKNYPNMQQYSAYTMREYLSMFTSTNLPGLSSFINVVIGVAVVIGFLVIFQAMYTAVMERTREIGILKAMGASKAYIVNVILRETLLLAVVGIAVGVAVSYSARAAIIDRIPTLRIMMVESWVWRAALIAIIGALLGAVYPAFKAAQKDPIDALAYE